MRCNGFITTVPTLVLALLAAVTLDPPIADAQDTCAQEVAAIQAYSKRIDKLIKQRQNLLNRRIFARLTNDARQRAGEWVELEGEAEKTIDGFAESAFAWAIEGKIVAAQITLQSVSRNCVHRVTYYYREDGTLARVSSTLNSFAGASIVLREQFYDRNGVALSKSSQRYTLRRASKSEHGQVSFDEPIPVYLTIIEFPFYREIDRFAAPSHPR